MRTGITFIVSAADRERLTALINDRNAPQKHVWRARMILLSGDGVGTVEIMRRTGKAKTCVWRWQERFAEEGFGGAARQVQTAINRFVAEHNNAHPKPFGWTADPDSIIAAVKRGHQALDSIH